MTNEVSPSRPLSEQSKPRELSRGIRRSLKGPIAAISFWGAIALPAIYIPLLVIGIETLPELLVFLGLFGLHLSALIIGHSYPHRQPAQSQENTMTDVSGD